MNVQDIKNRYGIVGFSAEINRSIEVASEVAKTDLTVLITGESGSGKEVFSKIIHDLSSRKHNGFIAVNCGAIPEGTIDSELFGHEKGAFTGAHDTRKGYFEQVNGGTIFLDEVGELPQSTQSKLLRILETKEFIRVGSSKIQKTDVRIIGATNVDLSEACTKGKFREDLYYRLNTVPIKIPPLRERKEDIHILFRKFASDFSHKYHSPIVQLDEKAVEQLNNYPWPGNVRQLKNITEQMSVLEKGGMITPDILSNYLPNIKQSGLPTLFEGDSKQSMSDRELLYQILFDMKKDVRELKYLVSEIISQGKFDIQLQTNERTAVGQPTFFNENNAPHFLPQSTVTKKSDTEPLKIDAPNLPNDFNETEEIEDSLSLVEKEADLIKKALIKYKGKRKPAADELGISERTLYRKIKNLNI